MRKISVKLEGHGYSLEYRRGYLAQPDKPGSADVSDELNAAMQLDTPEVTSLRLRAKVQLPGKNDPQLRVESVIDPSTVDFTTDDQGRHHAKLLVTLIAIADRDQASDEKPVTPPQVSGVYAVDLDSAAFARLLTSGMPMQLHLQLVPGSYRLRLGLIDVNSHHMGTLDMPIDVATAAKAD